MLILPTDVSKTATAALLADLYAISTAVQALPAGAGAPLARDGWDGPGAGAAPPIVALGRILNELVARGAAGKIDAAQREQLLALYENLKSTLPESALFFAAHRAAIAKMRARTQMLKRVTEIRAARKALKLMSATVDVHPDDLDRLRAFAASLLQERGIEPPPVKAARGRGQAKKTTEAPLPAPAPAAEPAVSPPRSRRQMNEEDFKIYFKSPPPPKAK